MVGRCFAGEVFVCCGVEQGSDGCLWVEIVFECSEQLRVGDVVFFGVPYPGGGLLLGRYGAVLAYELQYMMP
jgi:hypothetical protein